MSTLQIFKRHHTLTYLILEMLTFATWRLFAVLDWIIDVLTAKNVARFAPGWGFLLIICLLAPYVICGVGMFNVALREIPRFLTRNRIELAGTDQIIWGYIALAPAWVFGKCPTPREC